MTLHLSLYKSVKALYQPKKNRVLSWVKKSIMFDYTHIYININVVSSSQSQELNYQYRNINKATNVISLEYNTSNNTLNTLATDSQNSLLFGDLFLCDEVIVSEAVIQNKSIMDHYAHMIIHGVLHLQGFDHLNDIDAKEMESLEIDILQKFAINNPYKLYI